MLDGSGKDVKPAAPRERRQDIDGLRYAGSESGDESVSSHFRKKPPFFFSSLLSDAWR